MLPPAEERSAGVSWIASVFFAPVLAAKAEANFEASVLNEVPAAVKIAPLRPSSDGRNGRGVNRVWAVLGAGQPCWGASFYRARLAVPRRGRPHSDLGAAMHRPLAEKASHFREGPPMAS